MLMKLTPNEPTNNFQNIVQSKILQPDVPDN